MDIHLHHQSLNLMVCYIKLLTNNSREKRWDWWELHFFFLTKPIHGRADSKQKDASPPGGRKWALNKC